MKNPMRTACYLSHLCDKPACAVWPTVLNQRSKSMGRAILAVIVSYVAMFVLTFLAFTCAYVVLGADQAFKPRMFLASNRWIALSFVIQIIVAIIGGFICAAIAKGGKAPLALAILVLVIGLLL